MRSISIVALLAFLAVSAHVALAADCDDGECSSTIAVSQRFNSGDCSGNGTLHIELNYTNPCAISQEGDYNVSRQYTCSESGGMVTTYRPNTDVCSASITSADFVKAIGFCKQTGASTSEILWCNKDSISDKFKAAQNPTNASVVHDTAPCNPTTGCSSKTGTLAVFDAAGCDPSHRVGIYPPSTLAQYTMDLDTCYVSNATNVSPAYDPRQNIAATCSNGQFKLAVSRGGCGASASLVSYSSYPTGQCFHYNAVQWIYITCPSAASTLIASGSLVFFAILAFLLI